MPRRDDLPQEVLDATPASRASPVEVLVTVPAIVSYVEAIQLLDGNIDDLTGDEVLEGLLSLSITDYRFRKSRMYRLTKKGLLVGLALYSLAMCDDLPSAFDLVETCEDTCDTSKVEAMLRDYQRQKARPN
jgi:hypothetical protein